MTHRFLTWMKCYFAIGDHYPRDIEKQCLESSKALALAAKKAVRIPSAQGAQSFTSSRMSPATKQAARASFQHASRSDVDHFS
jgi:hypothetical protein